MTGRGAPPRRRFGSLRQLPSGQWQARYTATNGRKHPAPHTFERKGDATRWLTQMAAEVSRGDWFDPSPGRAPFGDYAEVWVRERDLSETTRERYEGLVRNYLDPAFGSWATAAIRKADVRRWRRERLDSGTGGPNVAKAYRLLRAILNTAVDDGLIHKNPCRIKGAGEDEAAERPVLSLEDVFELSACVPPHHRALVLLATFTSLRFGELASLRRSDVDLAAAQVRVRSSQAELARGRTLVKAPKSSASRRTVTMPAVLVSELRTHLDHHAAAGADGLVFVGPKGGVLRRRNFQRTWTAAVRRAGLSNLGLHFHDLRHTGNHLAAVSGASTRELMARMGHSTMRAALIYQHATAPRDRAIAEAINAQIVGRNGAPGAETNGAQWHAGGTSRDRDGRDQEQR